MNSPTITRHLANLAYVGNKGRGSIANAADGVYKAQEQFYKDAASILRAGDNIEVVATNKKERVAPTFSTLVDQFLSPATSKLQGIDQVAINSTYPNNGVNNDLISLMDNLNTAEIALSSIIAMRDKFISAYQEITRTAL